jgi:hypothetical protein
MKENSTVLLPINFNCWKHHAGFIKEQIKSINSETEIEKIKSSLLKIGGSQMDLYYGKYSPKEISEQIINLLNRKKIFSSEQYYKWLSKDGKDYQLVKLKDKSIWTLRYGETQERYVHIHPGRSSPNTVRVKAITLKTAILILCFKQIGAIDLIDTEKLNNIRKRYLDEPPVKSFSTTSGVQKFLEFLYN